MHNILNAPLALFRSFPKNSNNYLRFPKSVTYQKLSNILIILAMFLYVFTKSPCIQPLFAQVAVSSKIIYL